MSEPEYMQELMHQFASGMELEDILESHKHRLDELKQEREIMAEIVRNRTKIIDGLAICDLSETGHRSNGYLVTALAGSDAIACCVIHGYMDGSIEDVNRPALGASFYANSFRGEDNPYDLSILATLLDETGGGHANACGCRIQPSDGSKRNLIQGDKESNLENWIEKWSKRDSEMKR